MRVFVSHSSRTKPLVREVLAQMPAHVKTWIDENELLLGDDLDCSLEKAIRASSDFLILFLDDYSCKSTWVRKELAWALGHEKEIGRSFVLPVVIDLDAWNSLGIDSIRKKKYVSCVDFSERGIRSLATDLVSELFALVSRELELVKNKHSGSLQLLDQVDTYLTTFASEIITRVYSHRRERPLLISSLYQSITSESSLEIQSLSQFEDLLVRLRQHGYLAGIVSDGDTVYIEEEHFGWKTAFGTSAKRKIANEAIRLIKSGCTIALDSGSTTLEIARNISKNMRMQVLRDITIVTNSIAAAHELATTASQMGLDDTNSVLRLIVVGGRVRCNTLAIVGDIYEMDNVIITPDSTLAEVQEVDFAFVGANGIDADAGFTTHTLVESRIKRMMLNIAKQGVIVADCSKFGAIEEFAFASLDDNLLLISATDDGLSEASPPHENFKQRVSGMQTKVMFAK